jgi:glyoxylase-like metal-dependent hydrolase (beta-lactamase superfamily II)
VLRVRINGDREGSPGESMGVQLRQVTPSILCLRRASYFTCSYIVRTACGVVLVDAGMNSDGADIEAGLSALGAKATEIRAILLTHWHNDHSAGAAVAQQRSGAAVYYHHADEPYFSGATGSRGVRRWVSDRIPEVGVFVLAKGLLGESTPRPVSAQHFVSDGDRVLDDFDVVGTPGHTEGHVSYFYRPERTLFAGDALAVVDGRVRFMARPVTLDVPAARRSMAKCVALNPRIVCPGHREPLVDAADACADMKRHLDSGGHWPFFG